MKHRNLLISLTLIIGAFTLAACGGGGGGTPAPAGGGGGGGGGGVTASAPTAPIAITEANSDQVADESLDAFDNMDNGFDASSVVSPTDAKRTKFSDLVSLVRKKHREASPTLVVGATTGCTSGGTITYPDSVLTFPLTITFDNCAEPEGTFNGSITITGNGNLDGTFNGTFTFNNLTINGTINFGLNGSLTVSYTDDGVNESGSVSSAIIQITEGSEVTDITNLNVSYTENYDTGASTEDVNYTVNSTKLNGSVNVATIQIIQYRNYNEYPYAGQVVITGSGGTKIRLTAISDVFTDLNAVRKEVDTGSGYGAATFLSWEQLENAGITP